VARELPIVCLGGAAMVVVGLIASTSIDNTAVAFVVGGILVVGVYGIVLLSPTRSRHQILSLIRGRNSADVA
jgi:hypothetical protein